MKNKNLLSATICSLVVIIILTNSITASAQSLDPVCDGILDEDEMYFLPSCSRSSDAWFEKYGNQEYWIPDPANYDYTPIKTIRVNIHLMQQESPLPLGNFDADDPDELEWIYDLFASVNNIYSNICEPSDPITCVCGSNCHIGDSRIRFEIQAVYEHQDDAFYDNTSGIFSAYATNEETELNYFFMGYEDGTANGACSNTPNYTSMSANTYLYSFDLYDNYLNNIYAAASIPIHLAHELGHALGLLHTYEPTCCHESCDASSFDYLDDVFGSDIGSCTKTCWHSYGWSCDVNSSSNSCTNNMMGGTGAACYFSPEQIGRMQRALHTSHFRKYVADCPTTTQELIIDQDETWDFDIRIYNETIRVTSGNVLTLACKLYLPTDANIIIEQGAELILDGGSISKSCDGLWQGIEVWGVGSGTAHPDVSDIYTGAYPVDDEDHGVIYLKDEAKIEYARNAITTSKYDDFGNAAYRGGIVVAHGATFLNCKRSVEFMQYDFVPTAYQNQEDDNISEFYRCNFEVNDDYPCAETFNTHVTMWDVDGVIFIGNTFKDLREACTNNGRGIYSIDATYTVASDLCGGETPCDDYVGSFEGFYKGIEAENSSYRPLDIVVGDNLFVDNYRGILLSNVSNSVLISNAFEVPDIPTTSYNAYGIYLEDCVGYQVENNNFTTFGSYDDASPFNGGIYAVNNSDAVTEIYRNNFENLEAGIRVQTENSRLQLKCNSFISPIERHDIYVTNTGLLAHQGQCLGGVGVSDLEKAQAMANNVFTHDCNNSEGDIKIFSGHPELKYRHHPSTPMTPSCYTTGTTYVTPITCANTTSDGCPSKLPSGGTGYRLDGKNEPQTAHQLLIEIQRLSSAISDLQSLIAVENAEYELEYTADYDEIENNDLVYLMDEKDKLLREAVNLYYLEGKIDSAILIIENEDVEWSLRKIAELQIISGDYSQAKGIVDGIPSSSQENTDFKILAGVLIAIGENGRPLDSLTESEISTLLSIAGKQSNSSVAAENILTFVTGVDYPEIIDPDDDEKENRQIQIQESVIMVYPNPASNELVIDIHSPDDNSDYSLVVCNISGVVLHSGQIAGNSINYLDISSLPSGVLIVKILEGNSQVTVEKIIHY